MARFGKPLVCLTMNIPGPQKDSPLIRLAFEEGTRRLLRQQTPVYTQILHAPTGPEGYFVMDMPAARLKEMTVAAEEQDALGRLLDMDVLSAAGEKQARMIPRACLLCGEEAALCARSRAHGLEALQERVGEILVAHAAAFYGDAAYRALLAEALITPKPGLVDGENNGAHADMCLSLLLQSAQALRPFFAEFVRLGMAGAEWPALKQAGLAAESAMLQRTHGVNAHKGALYSLGLLLCAQGKCLMSGGDVLQTAAALAACEKTPPSGSPLATHGEALYARYGVKGARGEAAAGFPHALSAARALERYAALSANDAGALALCETMETLEDTNLLHRGGPVGLAFVQARAKEINALPQSARIAALREMDADLIYNNLSPGGAADMLALGLYLAETVCTPPLAEAIFPPARA